MFIIGSIRGQRQQDNEIVLDIGSIAAAGERCIDEVVMVADEVVGVVAVERASI